MPADGVAERLVGPGDEGGHLAAGRQQPVEQVAGDGGEVLIVGKDLAAVACELLDRLLSGGGELATLVVGPDEALGDAVSAHMSAGHPPIEVIRYGGGPAGIPLQAGVE